jgi:hypothetical protein
MLLYVRVKRVWQQTHFGMMTFSLLLLLLLLLLALLPLPVTLPGLFLQKGLPYCCSVANDNCKGATSGAGTFAGCLTAAAIDDSGA